MQKNILSIICVFLINLSLCVSLFAEPSSSVPSQGLSIGMENGLLTVQKVYTGSSGYAAGIQKGDTLLAIGDTTTAGMTPRDVSYVLDFNPGSTVGVAVIRDGVTKFVYLQRRNPMEQWKLAWAEDQKYMKGKLGDGTLPDSEAGDLIYGPGHISYATSDSEMDAMNWNSSAGGTGSMDRLGSGSVTYEQLYQEVLRLRKQLMDLTHSVDKLTDKVESVRPNDKPAAERTPSKSKKFSPTSTTPSQTSEPLDLEIEELMNMEDTKEDEILPELNESLPPSIPPDFEPVSIEEKNPTCPLPEDDLVPELKDIDNPKPSKEIPSSKKHKPASLKQSVREVPPTPAEDIIKAWENTKK